MRAQILLPTPENLCKLGKALRSGDLVAIPTETVYGLAGDALNTVAVSKIFEAKERPTFDPLIVHVPKTERSVAALDARGLVDASRLSKEATTAVNRLIDVFWPGPLTLVLPKNTSVPDLVTSGLATVGIRMPSHPAAQALLEESQVSLAAPSANRFGRISPTCAADVLSELGDRIKWILDGGRSEVGLESTVAAITTDGHACILRPGAISATDITSKTGIPAFLTALAPGPSGTAPQLSPGALSSHYAPTKSLTMLAAPIAALAPSDWASIRELLRANGASSIGVLVMEGNKSFASLIAAIAAHTGLSEDRIHLRALSRDGSLREIAHKLFSSLRELDDSAAELLFSEPSPTQEGLGFAIADRLRRASFKRQGEGF